MRAYGISCGGVTRCTRAALTVSASKRCLASWAYCGSAGPGCKLVRESAMKPVGKPDALIGHVRFDERGWETGRRSVRQCSRPSSTLQTGLVLAPAQQLEWLANSRMRGRPMPGSLLATLD